MNQQNFKLYYVLPAVILIIIIAIVLLLPKKSNPTPATPTPTTQLPTLIPTEYSPMSATSSTGSQGKNITPTLIPVTYTGAIEGQQLPQAEADLAVQKIELRKKLPLIQPTFTITFDYSNDVFVVALSEPKDTSKTQFSQWLQANYPAIPLDRFTFK